MLLLEACEDGFRGNGEVDMPCWGLSCSSIVLVEALLGSFSSVPPFIFFFALSMHWMHERAVNEDKSLSENMLRSVEAECTVPHFSHSPHTQS